MRILFVFALVLCGCQNRDDAWKPVNYSERGVVRQLVPDIPWDKTFGATRYLGTTIIFERDKPEGQVIKITIYGIPPLWAGMHARIDVFHGCRGKDFEECGDFIDSAEDLNNGEGITFQRW